METQKKLALSKFFLWAWPMSRMQGLIFFTSFDRINETSILEFCSPDEFPINHSHHKTYRIQTKPPNTQNEQTLSQKTDLIILR